MTRQSASYYRLLGDLSDVPDEYIRDVSHMKRFLERWTMDPKYQEAFASDPEAALTDLGIDLTPAEVIPLMDREAAMEATRLVRAGRAAEVPPAVLRYRYFIHEKIEHRRRQRAETVPGDPRLRAWRERMINRCIGELGQDRADQIVHAPAALELSKGCTVGCWFCGVAAPKFDSTLKYTDQNGQLWRECLGVLAEVYGISARSAFLYWATDPLDNPDYEHFLTDFYDVFGVCPQTTTAQGQKDIERTRRVLRARPFAGLARRPVLDHRAELAVPRARGVHPRGTAAGGVRAAEQGVGRGRPDPQVQRWPGAEVRQEAE